MKSKIRRGIVALFLSAVGLLGTASAASDYISSPTPEGPLTLTAYDYLAWGFCGVTWNNVQFLNNYDHGRCLSTSMQWDWQGENNNPTEQGSDANGPTPNPSSSVMLSFSKTANSLDMTQQMANWRAVNGVTLSATKMRKEVTMAPGGVARAWKERISFILPANESHYQAQFEIITAYFNTQVPSLSYWHYRPDTQVLTSVPHSVADGEKDLPVIFSTASQGYAMGVWSPEFTTWTPTQVPAATAGGYGIFTFEQPGQISPTNKWNVVKRVPNPIAGATYSFDVYVIVGTLASVKADMTTLYNLYHH